MGTPEVASHDQVAVKIVQACGNRLRDGSRGGIREVRGARYLTDNNVVPFNDRFKTIDSERVQQITGLYVVHPYGTELISGLPLRKKLISLRDNQFSIRQRDSRPEIQSFYGAGIRTFKQVQQVARGRAVDIDTPGIDIMNRFFYILVRWPMRTDRDSISIDRNGSPETIVVPPARRLTWLPSWGLREIRSVKSMQQVTSFASNKKARPPVSWSPCSGGISKSPSHPGEPTKIRFSKMSIEYPNELGLSSSKLNSP